MHKEAFTHRRGGLGVGVATLLTVFTLLMLTLVSMLSFSAARQNRDLQRQNAEAAQRLEAGEQLLCQTLAQIDAALLALQQEDTADYAAAVLALLARDFGCETDGQANTALLAVPVDIYREWVVRLEILPAGAAYRYILLERYVRLTDAWQPSESYPLLGGQKIRILLT